MNDRQINLILQIVGEQLDVYLDDEAAKEILKSIRKEIDDNRVVIDLMCPEE